MQCSGMTSLASPTLVNGGPGGHMSHHRHRVSGCRSSELSRHCHRNV